MWQAFSANLRGSFWKINVFASWQQHCHITRFKKSFQLYNSKKQFRNVSKSVFLYSKWCFVKRVLITKNIKSDFYLISSKNFISLLSWNHIRHFKTYSYTKHRFDDQIIQIVYHLQGKLLICVYSLCLVKSILKVLLRPLWERIIRLNVVILFWI